MWPCLCLKGLVTAEPSEEPGDAIVALSRRGDQSFLLNREAADSRPPKICCI